ncbi:Uridine kinase [Paenibacillus tianmuensis]|uniref:Phosphoribulokinase n=1 Tax=Paenibacillus tianmuensis TaxID=624147 RepID=A0A1G4TVW3_9BACL|nr:hypothetical protein [Paenibacillus tianmuensis]SCW85552.1 Uridine kinase [Paenibacillus tianmuensis]
MPKKLLYNNFFTGIIVVKVIIMTLFSSAYQDDLFIPFVNHFISNLDNPWQYYWEQGLPNSFPYPPLMLYILSFFGCLAKLINGYSFQNFFFKLPMLLADVLIYFTLLKLFPSRKKEILIFYFASPFVFYAAYIHSQLDLIPTALLFFSIYLLVNDKGKLSSLVFGLALSIKFPVIAALPLLLLFLFKNKKQLFFYLLMPFGIYLFFSLPFITSLGYINLVLLNTEQKQVFDMFFGFQGIKIYFAPLAILLIYARFMGYPKINNDLLFSSMGLLFSVFILLVPPMPAWYLWVIPFVSIYFINYYSTNARTTILLNSLLAITYIIYFIVFHNSSLVDIKFLNNPIETKINISHFKNLSFTLLEGSLLSVIYFLYRFGIRSNSVYKKQSSSFIIGVGGDSGAGKSTLLSDVTNLLASKSVLHIEGDGDHKWERGNENWKVFTHLNPRANYLHRQSDDLLALKKGESIERVEYDHDTGKFTNPQKVKSSDYIIMAGLHPFYLPKMRKLIDLKIYLETDESLRRHWKVLRDTKKRGYSVEKVLEQIETRMPDAQKYIWPQRKFSDLVISYFTDDDFEIGNPNHNPKIKLKLTVDSNVDLEPLIYLLERADLIIEHDYSEDLNMHYIIIDENRPSINFKLMADQLIKNKEEIIHSDSKWSTGFHGLVQLVVLIMISEKMKEIVDYEV